MLSEAEILAPFDPNDRRHRRLRQLAGLLMAWQRAEDQAGRVDGLAEIARWVAEPDRQLPLPPPPSPGAPPSAEVALDLAATVPGSQPAGVVPPASTPRHRRLLALLAVLETPTVQAAVRAQLAVLLAQAEGVNLLAGAGLSSDRGLLHETADRLFRRVLPTPRDDHDLGALIVRMFPDRRALGWLQTVPPPLFLRLQRALGGPAGGPGPWSNLQADVRAALVLIGARAQGLGLSQALRDRSRPLPLLQSPFYLLPRAADRLLAEVDRAAEPGRPLDAERPFQAAIEGCREELSAVLTRLEATGISVDVVFSIQVIEEALRRLEHLAAVLVASPGPARVTAGFRLLVVVVRARLSDHSLPALAYQNLHLLARKLVERAGRTGEHYIANTRREYWQLLASAAGGGLLTLGTAALKLQISSMFLPLFLEGLMAGAGYALSFFLIQLCGFTLATKQPSMTAATLAASIGENAGGDRTAELGAQVARIVRSQLAAAMGNITTVVAAAVALDVVWRWRTGQAVLEPERAAYVLASLHPLQSGTIWYATLTGVILWASGLAGGWIENFAVYHRLPQAIAEHPLGRLVGQQRMRALSGFIARNISGYGGSLALGLMLGMTPPLGVFFGLPLDVRHVTLSSGTLALAASAGGVAALRDPAVLAAMAGIAIIFVCNLGISFFLALTVALRAREVARRDRWVLFVAIARRFLRRPHEFLLPP